MPGVSWLESVCVLLVCVLLFCVPAWIWHSFNIERLKIENEAERWRDAATRAEQADQRAKDRAHAAMLQREEEAAENERLKIESEAKLRRDAAIRAEQADQRAKDRDHEAMLLRVAAEKQAAENERLKTESEGKLRRDAAIRAEQADKKAKHRDHEAMLQQVARQKQATENERRKIESEAEQRRDAAIRAELTDQRAKDRDHEAMLQREKLAAEKLSEERKLVAEQFSEERNLRLETAKVFTEVYKTAAAHSPIDMRALAGSLHESSQSVMMLCSQPGQGLAQLKLSNARPDLSDHVSDVGGTVVSCASARRASHSSSCIAQSFDYVESAAPEAAVDQNDIADHSVLVDASQAKEGDVNAGDERDEGRERRKQGHGQRRRKQKWLQTVQAPTPTVQSNQS